MVKRVFLTYAPKITPMKASRDVFGFINTVLSKYCMYLYSNSVIKFIENHCLRTNLTNDS